MACWPRPRRVVLRRVCESLWDVLEWLLAVVRRVFAANAGSARRLAEIRSANPARDEDILIPPNPSEDLKNTWKSLTNKLVRGKGKAKSTAAAWITLDTAPEAKIRYRRGSEKAIKYRQYS